MTLSELTDPNAVLEAINEYDRIGREAFLAKYGYASSRRYLLEYAGRQYDSKAIVGAAYGYQFLDRGPLAAGEFVGGEATVRPLLERLGFTVVDLDAAGFGITAQDIELMRSSRPKSKFAELNDDERAAYQRVHRCLAMLGALVQAKLGSADFSLKLTSGFNPKSGVRGYLPKDLWFAVSNVRNDEFERMPQLFTIVSNRGIEYGFAACIPPRQFSDQTIQQRVRAVAPDIFAALPAPASAAAIEWQQRLEQSGGWFLRRETRADPPTNDFTSLNEWLSFLKSPEGGASAGGAISRYLSLEDLSGAGERLADLVGEMAATFFDPMHQVVSSGAGAAMTNIQRGLETFLSSYKAVQESVPFGQHDELKELFNQIRSSLERLPSVRAHSNVRVSWSLGAGNWAKIPWIALADDRETSSTQRGRYGAFLFPEDMSGVYLTLNQGVKEVIEEFGRPKGRQLLRDRAQEIRALVRDRLSSRFNLDDGIDLHTEGTLGQDYEASTVAYRFYRRGEIPDDATINQDLAVLLDAYADILGRETPSEKGAWIFQANPKIFDIDGALKALSQLTWTVKKESPAVGDRVFIWRSGREAGVIALATVTEAAAPREQFPEEVEFASDPEQFEGLLRGVVMHVDRVLPEPLLRTSIAADPRLQDLAILRFAQQGVFKMSPHHAEALAQLIEELAAPATQLHQQRRVWIYAPGHNAEHWDEFYQAGIMAIGWGEIGDLNQFGSVDDVLTALEEAFKPERRPTNNARTCFDFAHTIQIGDRVFVKRGLDTIIGYGVVTGPYEFRSERPYYNNVRTVHWEGRDTWESPTQLPQKALTEITHEAGAELERLVGGLKPSSALRRELYTIEDALNGLFMAEEDFRDALSAWVEKKNLILQGPPGVGKTFVARRLAYALMGARDPSRVRMVQFHPSYSYEDFVAGYRPSEIGFVLKQGVFREFCERALAEPNEMYVFVIDEINRGNLGKILGELMLLIEADKRSPDWAVKLAYALSADERFYVPPNLYLLGMMNTADRSLSLVDYALRRRFDFVSLQPEFHSEVFRSTLHSHGASAELVDLIVSRLDALNAAISGDEARLGPGYQIGHSFFVPTKVEQSVDHAWYRRIVQYEIAPLLKEYWFDNPGMAETWTTNLLAGI